MTGDETLDRWDSLFASGAAVRREEGARAFDPCPICNTLYDVLNRAGTDLHALPAQRNIAGLINPFLTAIEQAIEWAHERCHPLDPTFRTPYIEVTFETNRSRHTLRLHPDMQPSLTYIRTGQAADLTQPQAEGDPQRGGGGQRKEGE